VPGTPTLILLDKQGIVQLRAAGLQEIEAFLSKDKRLGKSAESPH
jgi:hypothetical protein